MISLMKLAFILAFPWLFTQILNYFGIETTEQEYARKVDEYISRGLTP